MPFAFSLALLLASTSVLAKNKKVQRDVNLMARGNHAQFAAVQMHQVVHWSARRTLQTQRSATTTAETGCCS